MLHRIPCNTQDGSPKYAWKDVGVLAEAPTCKELLLGMQLRHRCEPFFRFYPPFSLHLPVKATLQQYTVKAYSISPFGPIPDIRYRAALTTLQIVCLSMWPERVLSAGVNVKN